jgi:hypothetical protein
MAGIPKMSKDDKKGTTSIEYNHLNLPKKVSKGATDYIVYTNDASGRKLAQEVFGSTSKITEYAGEYLYESGALQFVNHEEERIVPDNLPGAPRPWEYQYFLKDHLESVRVTFSEKMVTTEYKATLEDDSQSAEQSTFRNYNSLGGLNEYDHTDAGDVYTKSHWLNGGGNYQGGVSKKLCGKPRRCDRP